MSFFLFLSFCFYNKNKKGKKMFKFFAQGQNISGTIILDYYSEDFIVFKKIKYIFFHEKTTFKKFDEWNGVNIFIDQLGFLVFLIDMKKNLIYFTSLEDYKDCKEENYFASSPIIYEIYKTDRLNP